jgi:hypothetical protein
MTEKQLKNTDSRFLMQLMSLMLERLGGEVVIHQEEIWQKRSVDVFQFEGTDSYQLKLQRTVN